MRVVIGCSVGLAYDLVYKSDSVVSNKISCELAPVLSSSCLHCPCCVALFNLLNQSNTDPVTKPKRGRKKQRKQKRKPTETNEGVSVSVSQRGICVAFPKGYANPFPKDRLMNLPLIFFLFIFNFSRIY